MTMDNSHHIVESGMRFPAKILLFGEYNLVMGQRGFLIPFFPFSGFFTFENQNHNLATTSNKALFNFASFLTANHSLYSFLDVDRFLNEVAQGIWFNSSVPQGSGLGSSGALVAAVYQRYGVQIATQPAEVKQHLALIERFFHGQSSGADPLTAFLQRPILLLENNEVQVLQDWKTEWGGLTIFLVHTGIFSKTDGLVSWFLDQFQCNTHFRNGIERIFVPLSNRLAVGAAYSPSELNLDEIVQLSEFQLDHFEPMIPESFRSHIRYGVETYDFALKLCGSGGGGYLLGFTTNLPKAEIYFKKNGIEILPILQ